jgi:hypothetical protein
MESLDTEKAKSALSSAVIATFAEMAFMDVVPRISSAAGTELHAGERTCAVIDVLKPLSVQIQCFFPSALRDRIVDTLFAGDWSETQDKDDSVLELLNVIAGNFLSEYFGQGVAYKLQLPQFLYSEDEGQPLISIDMDAEGVPFRVAIRSVRYTY